MSEHDTLAELDVDGAIREAAEKVDPTTRAAFLKKAAAVGGGVVAGGAFMGGLPSIALGARKAGIPASDIAILNFALTLEYLEAKFYREAVDNHALSGEPKRFAAVVSLHEAQHVAFLKKVLGSKAVAEPKFDFKDTVTNEGKFLATADVLENTGVHAYLGQVGNIKAKPVLMGAASILPVEARHASWVRDIRYHGGTNSPTTPAPAGFEEGFTKAKILQLVNGTGFIVG
jgi:hypothetical protein